ncbi:hypothetical protein HZC09_05265 [Candidatus Micrarchaeota archaeon]|nr:hypothetical protein [Candidatus Micrarchaeota archaeon]
MIREKGKTSLEEIIREAKKHGIQKKEVPVIRSILREYEETLTSKEVSGGLEAGLRAVKAHPSIHWFNAKFHVDPLDYLRYDRPKSHTFVLQTGNLESAKLFGANSLSSPNLNHVPNALAYARFVPQGDKLVVFELQSDLGALGLPYNVRKPFKDWHKILLWKMKEYAKEKGFKEVWVTTGDWQRRKWKELHPSTILETYGNAPLDMGFTLVKTPETKIEGVKSNLFWVAKA